MGATCPCRCLAVAMQLCRALSRLRGTFALLPTSHRGYHLRNFFPFSVLSFEMTGTDDEGPSRVGGPPTLEQITELLSKGPVKALIANFPHIKARVALLKQGTALADVPATRAEIVRMLGLTGIGLDADNASGTHSSVFIHSVLSLVKLASSATWFRSSPVA